MAKRAREKNKKKAMLKRASLWMKIFDAKCALKSAKSEKQRQELQAKLDRLQDEYIGWIGK